MPRTWRIAYYPSDGKFRWTLLADDQPEYESPESYDDETQCRKEVEKIKGAKVDKANRRPGG